MKIHCICINDGMRLVRVSSEHEIAFNESLSQAVSFSKNVYRQIANGVEL